MSRFRTTRINRRDSDSIGGVVTPPTPVLTTQLSGFEAQDTYYNATPGDPPLGGIPCSCAVWIRLNTFPDATNQQALFETGNAASRRGYYMEVFNGFARCYVAVDVGFSFSTPLYTVQLTDVGKDLLFHMNYDGNFARFYRNGVQVGSGNAAPNTYVAPDPADVPNIGSAYHANRIYTLGIVGVVASDTDLVDPAAHFSAVQNAGDMVSYTNATHGWRGSDSNDGAATWPAFVGAIDMLRVNTQPIVTTISPDWAP